MKWILPLALSLTLLLALILRVPGLDRRPFHNDEAVNAVKFRALFEQGHYRYDANEYHGPLLHYGTLMLAWAAGWPSFARTTEASFRWVTVLAGVALIPMLWLTRDALGRPGSIWAAVLTALSPSLVFFSRDYIHETLLVSGTFFLMGCLWRYTRSPDWKWAMAAGFAAALMQATKETCILNFAAMGLAGAGLWLWQATGQWPRRESRRRWLAHGLVMAAAWAVVSVALFSSFGRNLSGPVDSVRTYLLWWSRAHFESSHLHPWWFYAQRLLWEDSGAALPWTDLGLLLLAVVGGGAAITGRGLGDANAGFLRWLALYTGILFLIYSAIPYKTPWCILGVVHGLVLLAGVGLAVLWRSSWALRSRVALVMVVLLLLGHFTWQAWALSRGQSTARGNPWAYAETVPDIRNLIERVDQLAAVSPQGTGLNLQVVCEADDYWPLPYYLRAYNRVGWWSDLPPQPFAPVLIVSPRIAATLEANPEYVNTGAYQLRHGVFLSCYVNRNLWKRFLAARGSD